MERAEEVGVQRALGLCAGEVRGRERGFSPLVISLMASPTDNSVDATSDITLKEIRGRHHPTPPPTSPTDNPGDAGHHSHPISDCMAQVSYTSYLDQDNRTR